ncbi:MAG: anti-sigma-E factor RseA [Escherichia coli]|nr:anti-sigma-E factor RseA [Escherichia coli]
MSEQLTDQVLVERVQKGDQKAFNLLVVRYQHKVASLVSRYVPSGDVPDVVQEAFIKAYRALDSFRGDSAFYTWLYRIAVNTAKNYLVAQGRRPPSSDVDAIEAENFESGGALKEISNPENLMLSEELRQIVFRTIESLPEDLRMAITLRELDGLSYEEIAAIMDCPVGTVRSRIFDSELLNELAHNPEMQKTWESYHLIRDSMRGDTPEVLHFDISSRVMAAIEEEPVRQPATLIPEAQPAPHQWQKMPFWQKVRPWAAQLTQMGVAACVSLAVIVGVQHYNGQSETSQQPETPVFNTLPMMGKASPVSLGVPSEATANNGQQQQVQEQRRRINAMLQDYELQRRLHSEQLQFEQAQTQQAAVQVPGIQTLGTQSQ